MNNVFENSLALGIEWETSLGLGTDTDAALRSEVHGLHISFAEPTNRHWRLMVVGCWFMDFGGWGAQDWLWGSLFPIITPDICLIGPDHQNPRPLITSFADSQAVFACVRVLENKAVVGGVRVKPPWTPC